MRLFLICAMVIMGIPTVFGLLFVDPFLAVLVAGGILLVLTLYFNSAWGKRDTENARQPWE